MASKLSVLAIHHSRQLHRQLVIWAERLRFATYLAESRTEGLAAMYNHRPDIILLELIVDQDDSWRFLSTIRLFTDTPLVLIADRIPDPRPELLAFDNFQILVQPISSAKISWAVNAVLAASGARDRCGTLDPKHLHVAGGRARRRHLKHASGS